MKVINFRGIWQSQNDPEKDLHTICEQKLSYGLSILRQEKKI